MKLIEFVDYEIKISDEAMLVKPIRKLFTKDKSKNKETFLTQMSIIYFYADPRSNYNYITDDAERLQTIFQQEGFPANFSINHSLQEAIDVYSRLTQTSSSLLLQDSRLAIDKVREFLKTVDLTLLDDKGKPIYTINSITTALKQIPQLAKDLMEAEKAVSRDITEQGRARGKQGEKTLMDDGIL